MESETAIATPEAGEHKQQPLVLQFKDLPFDTKDMLMKQKLIIEEKLRLFRICCFRGEWESAREEMRALIESAEYLRDEANAQHEAHCDRLSEMENMKPTFGKPDHE